MPDQKLDNLLNLALDATEEEREKSRNLNVGYEKQTRKWEIIVKYSEMGDSVEALLGGSGISVVPLLGGYAIVTLPESMLEEYSRRPQIEFIEDVYKRQVMVLGFHNYTPWAELENSAAPHLLYGGNLRCV